VQLVFALAIAALVTARPGGIERVEHSPPSMVRIPGGTFWMGFPNDEDAESELALACVTEFGEGTEQSYCTNKRLWENATPERRVYLPAFEIDRYEVTIAQYRRCAADGACDVAALLAGDDRFRDDDALPMVYVTWQDAVDFCAWSGKRLPTEAEWEKAARGTDRRVWPWGDFERDDGANHGTVDRKLMRPAVWFTAQYIADDSDGHDTAVAPGTMLWSESAYEVYDLAGNVSEWVADYYVDGYDDGSSIAPVVDSPPPNGAGLRSYRGGSWAEPKLFGRTYFRLNALPDQRSFDRGFRCARDV
jgi:formylglycine-generating enzyme required for sulfatase activity